LPLRKEYGIWDESSLYTATLIWMLLFAIKLLLALDRRHRQPSLARSTLVSTFYRIQRRPNLGGEQAPRAEYNPQLAKSKAAA
jgi:hypothetical protein